MGFMGERIYVELPYRVGEKPGPRRNFRLGKIPVEWAWGDALIFFHQAIDLDIAGNRDGAGDGGDDGSGVVYLDPSLYENANPTAFCQPPCTFVFPPWVLPYTTTISPPPFTSTVFNQWVDVVTGQVPGGGGITTETTTYTTTTGKIRLNEL